MHFLWASISSLHLSAPFSTIQASRTRLVSGQAQHALHFGFFSSPSGFWLVVFSGILIWWQIKSERNTKSTKFTYRNTHTDFPLLPLIPNEVLFSLQTDTITSGSCAAPQSSWTLLWFPDWSLPWIGLLFWLLQTLPLLWWLPCPAAERKLWSELPDEWGKTQQVFLLLVGCWWICATDSAVPLPDSVTWGQRNTVKWNTTKKSIREKVKQVKVETLHPSSALSASDSESPTSLVWSLTLGLIFE